MLRASGRCAPLLATATAEGLGTAACSCGGRPPREAGEDGRARHPRSVQASSWSRTWTSDAPSIVPAIVWAEPMDCRARYSEGEARPRGAGTACSAAAAHQMWAERKRRGSTPKGADALADRMMPCASVGAAAAQAWASRRTSGSWPGAPRCGVKVRDLKETARTQL
eukprot:scaffold8694_cov101-Isochrysis_galbana.AAC.6